MHDIAFARDQIAGGGFREVGAEGLRLQQEMVAAAREHGMRLVGPNCLGLLNFANRMINARNDATRTSIDPARVVAGAPTDAAGLVDHCLQILVDGDVPSSVRAELVQYVRSGPGAFETLTPGSLDEKVRGLLHLIMSLPVYQMS